MATQKIETGLIADSAVTTAKLADNSVTAAKIAAGSLDDQVKGISSSADAVAITIDSSENVGIGASSPAYKLDLNGDMRFTTGSALFWGDVNVYEGRTGNDRYWVTGATERMRIDSSGNVGIGTSSPNARLEIKPAASSNYLQFNDSSDTEKFRIDSNFRWAWGTTTPTQDFDMRDTSGNAFFTLDRSNVKVGIGETSPDYKLHISGIGSSAQMQIESTSNSNAQLIFRNTSSAGSGATGGFHIGLLGDTSGDGLIYHHHDKPIRFYTNAANTMTLTGEDGMLHLNGRSGAYGYAVPQDEALGYTNNLNAGAFGILHRGAYDSYVTGNTYYYKTGGSSSWRAKYGAYKSTVMGMINGAFGFDTSTTAPGSNGAATIGLARRVTIDSDGLKFGSDTAAANALDDYEEGTWTPACGATLATAVGHYTKIGNQVTVHYRVVTTGGLPTSSSQVIITGLPFTANSNSMTAAPIYARYYTPNDSTLTSLVQDSEAQIRLINTNDQNLDYTIWGELEASYNNSVFIIGSATYIV